MKAVLDTVLTVKETTQSVPSGPQSSGTDLLHPAGPRAVGQTYSTQRVPKQWGRPAPADAVTAGGETVRVGSGLYIHFKANGTLQGQL